ncbi:DEAD/DEAH box helicase [Dactylosporangium salmoneum]|uniref:DEAD/DEAH box helicase n=1 Tax=Dactylosporangium salmoneum TaxID=53361 RepID=UPI0031D141C5
MAPTAIAALTGFILARDVAEVARFGALGQQWLPVVGERVAEQAENGVLDLSDAAALAAYGLTARAARGLVTLWRRGDLIAGQQAAADLRQASALLLDACVVDTWTLVDCLAHVVEDIVATSPWRMLHRASSWNPRWRRYVRGLALAEHPVVQVWPSQRRALDAGLLAPNPANLTVTMPTSAGKTFVAEWAILHALAEPASDGQPDKLAVYVVPSRALAGEVERHLTDRLGVAGLRVSGLFGGAEHVQFELRLIATTDVLVVTSEKLDLLLRNDPGAADRLALVLVDEGHLLGEGDRGLRLELLLTRILRRAATARMVVLSAVLPNAADIAGWLDPAGNAEPVRIDWSPSQLRVGVFHWRGQVRDGQHGVIDYVDHDHEAGFFLPYVLTRRVPRTLPFPREKKDIAAALAVHFDRLGPVLIASPTKPKAVAAARALQQSCERDGILLGANAASELEPDVLAERNRLAVEMASEVGPGSELITMVLSGIGYHHADVPEAVRQRLEAAYRAGTIRVLCATSTLSQGVNLPTKTVIIPDTWRGPGQQITVREFWNLAGRAGRAFRETEGHVILVADTEAQARRLASRYLSRTNTEPVTSRLYELYRRLAVARLGRTQMSVAELAALDLPDPIGSDTDALAWVETLDFQLLELLGEEVVDTADEALLLDAVTRALGETLAAHQFGAREIPLAPLAKLAARRVRALVAAVPDRATRAAFVRTGLSVAGCHDALTAATELAEAINANPALLSEEAWPLLRSMLLHHAVTVSEIRRSCESKGIDPAVLPALAGDWIDGVPLDRLRQHHGAPMAAGDAMRFTSMLDRIVVQDLAWVLSAILQMLELRLGQPATGPISAVSAMAKYGVPTVAACYAASIGIRDRAAAKAIGELYSTDATGGFPAFLEWIAQLSPAQAGKIAGPTLAKLLDRAAALLTPRNALHLITSGRGVLRVPLRGVRYADGRFLLRTWVGVGTSVELVRDYDNPVDPNAIEVRWRILGDWRLGYLAREVARVLAPYMDDEDNPPIVARIAVRPVIPTTDAYAPAAEEAADRLLWQRDVVQLDLTLRG